MDMFTATKRSDVMSRIRSKDTAPEVLIRKYLHLKGIRYRLYSKKIPGCPDIASKKYNAVIFYNGCFWHGHQCRHSHVPKTNPTYWEGKIERNKARDEKNIRLLQEAGRRILIVWGCAHRGKGKHRIEEMCSEIYNWLLSDSTYKEIPEPLAGSGGSIEY